MVPFLSIVAFAVAVIAAISYKRSRASYTDGNQKLFLVSVGAVILGVILLLYSFSAEEFGTDRHRTTFWELWLGRN